MVVWGKLSLFFVFSFHTDMHELCPNRLSFSPSLSVYVDTHQGGMECTSITLHSHTSEWRSLPQPAAIMFYFNSGAYVLIKRPLLFCSTQWLWPGGGFVDVSTDGCLDCVDEPERSCHHPAADIVTWSESKAVGQNRVEDVVTSTASDRWYVESGKMSQSAQEFDAGAQFTSHPS